MTDLRRYRSSAWRLLAASAIMLAALALSGCSDDAAEADGAGAPADDGRIKVVATVSPITSLAENIGGVRIQLDGLIPEGTNSHTFEPAPSMAVVLAQADLFIANGLFLEEPTIEMARANKKPGAVILTLGDKAISREEWVFDFSFPESDGHPNPHLWTSPDLALKYAEFIRDELVVLDPENAAYFEENFAKLNERIEDLDQRIATAAATIPPRNRKLLTYHDSFPFFGPRYGFEIIGAVQPSDFTEPSAREVADLTDQVRAAQAPAIFGSKSFPSPVMEQIADEGGARFIDQLRDDDLPGDPGDPRHTYLGLMLADVEIMVPALGGSTEALDDFDAGLVFEGVSNANYRQGPSPLGGTGLFEPFEYRFFVRGLIAATLVGGLCGMIGVYIVLRRMAYIGHGLSHAVFGGAVVSYVMSINFFVGASLWGFLSALLITATTRQRKIASDSAIGIITTASFALGIALISRYKSFTRSFDAALFGNILGVTEGDLLAIGVVVVATAVIIFVGYKLFLFATFDQEVAGFYGVPTGWMDTLFSLVLAATIVVSMQVLGVTMIAAAIVIPPIVARLLADNFRTMMVLSTVLGAVCGLAGVYLSFYVDVSSGASVVLFSAFLFVVALTYSTLRKQFTLTTPRASGSAALPPNHTGTFD